MEILSGIFIPYFIPHVISHPVSLIYPIEAVHIPSDLGEYPGALFSCG